jgi:hydrogenase maturation protein HypF
MALPGGDAAARDTRRCAAGAVWEVGRDLTGLFAEDEAPIIAGMLRSGRNCVASSAAGRLFDAVACLLEVCDENSHEAQAAMALEALANPHFAASEESGLHAERFVHNEGAMLTVDLLAYVVDLRRRKEQGEGVSRLAWEFHEVFAAAWAHAALLASQQTGVKTVALSGGVFCNEIVTKRISERLAAQGLKVLRHEVVPPNDGGIAFGQAAVVTALLSRDAKGVK